MSAPSLEILKVFLQDCNDKSDGNNDDYNNNDDNDSNDEYGTIITTMMKTKKMVWYMVVAHGSRQEGDYWVTKTSTLLKTIMLKFKLEEEFDDLTPDGRHVSSFF